MKRSLLFVLLLTMGLPSLAAAQTLTVSNDATLRLDGGGVLDLGPATTLVETTGGRITGGTGTIKAQRTLNAPSSENVAGLGATITSAADLGLTTVVRGHAPQTVDGSGGIARYYDITPTTNTGLNATLVVHYNESELGGLAEADLTLFRSEDAGTTWSQQGGTVDESSNTITLSGLESFSRWTAATTVQQALALAGHLLLQGPYNGTNMNTDLSTHLPETDPYYGTHTVPTGFFTTDTQGQQVVDWLWLELRSGDPASPPMIIEAEAAALLMSDGSIVAPDGMSDVQFDGVTPGEYYLVAGHRNHLAVMTPAAIDCTNGTCSHDFTGGMAYGTNAQINLSGTGTGPWACMAGDGNASGGTTATDQALWLQNNGTAGYLSGDYNLSGGNTATDQALWLQNNGISTQVPPGN